MILGLYPNPSTDYITIQLNDNKNSSFILKIIDLSGKELITKEITPKNISGLLYSKISTKNLKSGTYILQLYDNTTKEFIQRKFMKK